ncbi:hypothetical protein EMCG_04519 [[Emmonsia] crescens]|uniref:Uncharacterized protein n=1 Tax=[Emmonsia] crescens TaxID=73230 RepID=A0A0G2HRQ8_9EURO|nr:hypothetical protein EMCG_04519 [Emmonsia crescens UAMH 3008]
MANAILLSSPEIRLGRGPGMFNLKERKSNSNMVSDEPIHGGTEGNILLHFGSGFPYIVTRGVVYSPDPSTPCISTACNYCTPHRRLRIDPAKVVDLWLDTINGVGCIPDLFDQDPQKMRVAACVQFLKHDAKSYPKCQPILMLVVLVRTLSRVPLIGEKDRIQCCWVTRSIQMELFRRIHEFKPDSILPLRNDKEYLICLRFLLSVSITDARALQNTQHTTVNIDAAPVEDITRKLVDTFHSFYSEKAALGEEEQLKRHEQKFIENLQRKA